MEYDAKTRLRLEATAITRYLRSLYNEPDTDHIERRLREAEEKVKKYAENGQMLRMLKWIENRLQLQRQSESTQQQQKLEEDFIRHAAGYGQRAGVTYKAWREAGVSAAVLKKAGVK